jgi:hypothetical protein
MTYAPIESNRNIDRRRKVKLSKTNIQSIQSRKMSECENQRSELHCSAKKKIISATAGTSTVSLLA